jgi:hypothetical protein
MTDNVPVCQSFCLVMIAFPILSKEEDARLLILGCEIHQIQWNRCPSNLRSTAAVSPADAEGTCRFREGLR